MEYLQVKEKAPGWEPCYIRKKGALRRQTTVRTWVHRSIAFPAPWRKGGPGDSDLYLRADIEAWLAATGR